MTLTEQISLIDSMIRENPDYTIRDYLSIMAEIQSVSDSMKHKTTPFIFQQSITNGITTTLRETNFTLRFYSR